MIEQRKNQGNPGLSLRHQHVPRQDAEQFVPFMSLFVFLCPSLSYVEAQASTFLDIEAESQHAECQGSSSTPAVRIQKWERTACEVRHTVFSARSQEITENA